jgi:hypothetical protein
MVSVQKIATKETISTDQNLPTDMRCMPLISVSDLSEDDHFKLTRHGSVLRSSHMLSLKTLSKSIVIATWCSISIIN